ncbi:hypothetical protein PR202_ga11212 [Eleusine coracana subsp. coracana]|uniref:Uncharacterized protein n=1 Tax=Eleusine coracana subsp. coracana TaxID=191504 RepID=A0AAV5C8S1_ELECO|nr:hypothetical protein QOZ80_5AG0405450 [Eleusine coracana subsp. coracana]GJM94557.1 hypothetical protein PR202_ga11212 [Eleusine coracana subsp. coracana]
MLSTKKHLPEAEVKVQKVNKIEPVYNLVTRPLVYGKPKMMTVKKTPAAYLAVPGMNKIDRVLSAEDINHYIETKKKQFQQGENHQQHIQKQP